MRYFIIAFASFIFTAVQAQDKALLKKQLMQLMLAYPNKFRDIKNDGITYEFTLTGTTGKANKQLRSDTLTASMAIQLTRESNEAQANSTFDHWTALLNNTDFNGAKLVSKDVKTNDKMYFKSRIWKLDNREGRIDPKYANFSITMEILKIGQTYHPYLSIGDE